MMRGLATPSGPLSAQAGNTTGTPGDATMNTPAGKVAMAAGTSQLTVTNSLCKASSRVFTQVETPFMGLQAVTCTPYDGYFVMNSDYNAGGKTVVSFLVTN
jgi:hypothetical protein